MRCYYRTASGYEEGETEESKLIRTNLKDIETNEAVRAAVNEIGAKYVLVLDASNFKEMAEDLRHNRRNSCRRSAASYG
ncbi:MAG: hypothetical protein LIV26_10025 [Atopobium sp.]|nr:hypothetical protein [Atopobium sp.]